LESPKHLHQTAFETLKCLQQTMFGKYKKILKQKIAQKWRHYFKKQPKGSILGYFFSKQCPCT